MFGIFCQILRFLVEKYVFSASPGTTMQNHLDISSKSQFWIRNVEIGAKHKENILFLKYIFTKKCHFWPPDNVFDGFTVLMSSLAET